MCLPYSDQPKDYPPKLSTQFTLNSELQEINVRNKISEICPSITDPNSQDEGRNSDNKKFTKREKPLKISRDFSAHTDIFYLDQIMMTTRNYINTLTTTTETNRITTTP